MPQTPGADPTRESHEGHDPSHPAAARPGQEPDELSGGVTYRSLAEQRLTPREERFERTRRTLGLFLGPALLLLLYVLPMSIPRPQQNLSAVLAFVVVFWITEAIPIPVTGLVGMGLCALLGVEPADDIAARFGSTTLFTFVGAFIIAAAMLKHGLARRFAFRVLAVRAFGRSTARTLIGLGLVTALISAFISNTASTAMLLPTALGIFGTFTTLVQRGDDRSAVEHAMVDGALDPTRLRVGAALMLMLAYSASIGGLLTPIGSPPNLIGRGLIEEATGERIDFLTWMVVAIPVVAAMFGLLCLILLRINRPEVRKLPGLAEYVAEQRRRLGPLSVAERNTLVAFLTAVTFWVVPGVVALIAGSDSGAYETVSGLLDEGFVAVLAAALLFILPIDWNRREFTLNWSDAAGIDWGTIVLFGSGIVFGGLLRDTGLAERMGTAIASTFGISSFLPISIFAVLLAIIISETTSNTASAAVVIPIVLPVAVDAGVNPLIPGMAALFGASFGFMLPVSTPPNAIVYGSGFVPILKMVRSGVVFDLLGAVLILIGIPLMVTLVF